MRVQSSAIFSVAPAPSAGRVPAAGPGTLLAALGVLAFSFSLPATAWSLDGFGPWTATGLRGVAAAAIAGAALVLFRSRVPPVHDVAALAVVACGCVVGFPVLTALALQTSTTAHSAVVVGALPMTTATISVLRTGVRPSPAFWAAACAGAATVMVFVLSQSGGRASLADLYLVAAVLLCAAGYAEGGRLAARMAGWEVIAWAVVLAAPVNLVVAAVALAHEPVAPTGTALAGLAYIAAVSQFLGFVVWYRGMALIGVPRASQLQLAQPLLTMAWAVLFLDEHLAPAMPVTAVVVVACIVVTQRAGATRPPRTARRGRSALRRPAPPSRTDQDAVCGSSSAVRPGIQPRSTTRRWK